jgi:hypothetical protein
VRWICIESRSLLRDSSGFCGFSGGHNSLKPGMRPALHGRHGREHRDFWQRRIPLQGWGSRVVCGRPWPADACCARGRRGSKIKGGRRPSRTRCEAPLNLERRSRKQRDPQPCNGPVDQRLTACPLCTDLRTHRNPRRTGFRICVRHRRGLDAPGERTLVARLPPEHVLRRHGDSHVCYTSLPRSFQTGGPTVVLNGRGSSNRTASATWPWLVQPADGRQNSRTWALSSRSRLARENVTSPPRTGTPGRCKSRSTRRKPALVPRVRPVDPGPSERQTRMQSQVVEMDQTDVQCPGRDIPRPGRCPAALLLVVRRLSPSGRLIETWECPNGTTHVTQQWLPPTDYLMR